MLSEVDKHGRRRRTDRRMTRWAPVIFSWTRTRSRTKIILRTKIVKSTYSFCLHTKRFGTQFKAFPTEWFLAVVCCCWLLKQGQSVFRSNPMLCSALISLNIPTLVKCFPWAGTADACVPSTRTLSTRSRSGQCAGVTGLCRVHLFSLWPFDWRPQKSHDKIGGNARISAS